MNDVDDILTLTLCYCGQIGIERIAENGDPTAAMEAMLELDPTLTYLAVVDLDSGAVLARSGSARPEILPREAAGTDGQKLVITAGDQPVPDLL